MKKTAGLVALSFGLAATGCALVPQTVVKSMNPAARVSGPVTISVDNIPTNARSAQSLATNAVMLEVRVYKAASYVAMTTDPTNTNANGEPNVATSPLTGRALVATASVAAGMSTLTIPAMPAGYNIVQVSAYTAKNGATWSWADSANGYAPLDGAKWVLIGQTEGVVNAIAGIPTAVALPMYRVVPFGAQIADGTAYGGSATPTGSVTVSNISARSNGMVYVRLANLNPLMDMATQTIRISIVSPTAYASNLASTSGAAGYQPFWSGGWFQKGFTSTASINGSGWVWGDTARKVIYQDVLIASGGTPVNLFDGTVGAGSVVNNDGTSSVGAFSVALPAAFLPTGYAMTFTDLGSGSTLAGAGTL